ncbi:heat shock 70 kDa protein 12A-like [Mytilus trossulus]|uniref:heat shock 70 kDa protein 12A-like n=1 Tax=Mytilus trossulus TaxID=6551 RepID=UPI003006844F
MSDYLMVASIDFGTAYSGYAFSLTTDFKRDPLLIHSNQNWNAGNAQLMSLKTPTCILLDKDREIKSFGYEAESEYSQLAEEGTDKQEDYYFFYRFKMILYDNEKLKHQILNDVTGKTLAASEVFAKFIKALKGHLLTQFIDRGKAIEPHEIRWVLTVPTIWTDASKQFMRECAHQAGIDDNKLVIALEPEAASIFCLFQENSRASNERSLLNRTGQKYMIIDLGGGTADITIHERLPEGVDCEYPSLKELHHAIGDDCGGTQVDNAFMEVLREILGQKLVKLMKKKQPSTYLELLREFETVKRREIKQKNYIRIPFVTINELIEELGQDDIDNKIKMSKYKNQIKRNREKFCIDAELMKSFFGPTTDRIVSLVKETSKIKAIRDVSLFVLVGGFSECKHVIRALKEALPNKTFIIPDDPGLSVLKGAVIFGHKSIIESRVMMNSYGTKVFEPFDPDVHEMSRRKRAGGRFICPKIFDFIVKKNESVPVGTTIKREYLTDEPQQCYMDLTMYKSDSEYTEYTDEEGCYRVCKATIDIPNPSDEQRTVEVEYFFGDTEIRMTAVETDSGESCNTVLKFI